MLGNRRELPLRNKVDGDIKSLIVASCYRHIVFPLLTPKKHEKGREDVYFDNTAAHGILLVELVALRLKDRRFVAAITANSCVHVRVSLC